MRKGRLKRRLADALRSQQVAEHRAARASRDVARLRLACEAAPQGLVVCDEQQCVVVSNHNGLHDAPWSPLVEGVIDELLGPDGRSGHRIRSIELHGPPPKSLVVTAVPLDAAEDRLGAVAFVEDVSERRRLEQLRRDFVANVSHELRTPIGALGLLSDALAGETDPVVVGRLAGRISAEAERAGRMIEDLLDLSRIEGNGLDARDRVAVDTVVRSAVERVRPHADLKGVALGMPGGAGHLPDITGDVDQLVSALSNLLDNAVKYSDGGSAVKVKTRESGDGWIEITVRDKGIGIPSKDLDRIFERFYRVDRARSRETGGTGLGLSIVRHVAHNHGGEVTVTSSEGFGSTFVLRLPATLD